jgi:lipid A 3-O-deacylase
VPSFQRSCSFVRVVQASFASHLHASFTARKIRSSSVARALFALAPLLAALPAAAQEQRHPAMPDTAFVQAGVAAKETQMLVVGVTRDWDWEKEFSFGRATGYWEVSLGRWHSEGKGSQWVGQVGLTPVLRIHPRRWSEGWFIEGGIGANLLFPVYHSERKRFSTVFNFGDHIAVGKRFGDKRQHEVALRFQHFSNGGIEEPNPGEDFLQLRYSRQL